MVGALGFLTSSTFLIPQIMKVWENRNRPEYFAGLSAISYVITMMNAILWGTYAVMTKAYWSGAPGAINLPLCLVILWFIWKNRNETSGLTEPSLLTSGECRR